MATSYSVGHAMRRRSGIPSNPLETAGKSMARNNPTPGEHISANGSNNARVAMDPYAVTPAPVLTGALIPKKSVQAGDPTGMGSKQNRVNISYDERHGASYTVKAMFSPTIDPAAGATMANARIVPSVSGRQNPNFQMGEQSSYL